MSVEIEIKGHGGGVSIDVFGYENPIATNPSDANWLVCTMRIGIGPFHGNMQAAFTTQDFAQFARDLREFVEGQISEASFETDEQALELKIVGKPTGAVRITGTVQYSLGPEVVLSFRLESDQSYLQSVMDALSAVMKQFPVRT